MNTKSLTDAIVSINKQDRAETYARGGIRGIGLCISCTKNEHPLVRTTGAILAISPIGKSMKISLGISLIGFILAKNKKQALYQRLFGFGSTILVSGIISQLDQ